MVPVNVCVNELAGVAFAVCPVISALSVLMIHVYRVELGTIVCPEFTGAIVTVLPLQIEAV